MNQRMENTNAIVEVSDEALAQVIGGSGGGNGDWGDNGGDNGDHHRRCCSQGRGGLLGIGEININDVLNNNLNNNNILNNVNVLNVLL